MAELEAPDFFIGDFLGEDSFDFLFCFLLSLQGILTPNHEPILEKKKELTIHYQRQNQPGYLVLFLALFLGSTGFLLIVFPQSVLN